jgi:ubiquinone/menaquinone biosynthesis C-methylase UbiE
MYEESKAEEYWSKRLHETDPLAAVLSFSLPKYFNEAYSKWELACVLGAVDDWTNLRVLDVGCGIGRVTVPVAQAGAHVTAIDNSKEMLAACRAGVEAAAVGDRVSLRQASARTLPGKDGEFDVVLCLGVLEHLPPAVRLEAMGEIARVVKPHGTVLLVANSTSSVFLTRDSHYESDRQEPSGYHVSLIGVDKVRGYFEDKGFVVESLGSNLFQSLAKHLLKAFLPLEAGQATLDSMLQLCTQLDLEFRGKGDLDKAFADQFVLRARRPA